MQSSATQTAPDINRSFGFPNINYVRPVPLEEQPLATNEDRGTASMDRSSSVAKFEVITGGTERNKSKLVDSHGYPFVLKRR